MDNKTKSGKTAYIQHETWIEAKFKELMISRGISRTSKEYIEAQELYFYGACIALTHIPEKWKEKLNRKEPI